MTLPKCIIVELDGVLSDDSARRHFIYPQPQCIRVGRVGKHDVFEKNPLFKENWQPDWPAYHAAASDDPVNDSILELCERFSMESHNDLGREIIFITARPEKYREETNQWLSKRCCFGWDLFMRPDVFYPPLDPKAPDGTVLERKKPDNRLAPEVKCEIYQQHIRDKYDVLFCLERDEYCCKMWKRLGLQVLQVI